MTIVVDLGCKDYGSQDSVASLVDEYKPDRLYGFDPHPNLEETVTWSDGVRVELRRQAAWLNDGLIPFHENITRSQVGTGDYQVPCFDFSAWLANLDEHVILKMDVEGAEYELLERMLADGTDKLIDELVIEWHEDDRGLASRLSCPIRQWWM
jgi:FkbM family methyltransferase